MVWIKALCIAFSIYSKIPVPNFEWKEKEFKYNLIFFPWVGAVIGAALMLWSYVSVRFGVGRIAFVLIGTAIPLLVTGGFHVDGYMDTMDAFSSHKTREEKLRILKDPHIGAFAVIMLAVLGFVYIAAFSEINLAVLPVFACSFFLTRSLSGISVISFPKAKKDGMLYTFSSAAGSERDRVTLGVLICECAACAALMIWLNPVCGGVLCAAAAMTFLYYRYRSVKELGGITGDTAGYFVTISETVMCIAAAAVSIF